MDWAKKKRRLPPSSVLQRTAPKREGDEEDGEKLVEVGPSVGGVDIGVDAPLDVGSEGRGETSIGHSPISY